MPLKPEKSFISAATCTSTLLFGTFILLNVDSLNITNTTRYEKILSILLTKALGNLERTHRASELGVREATLQFIQDWQFGLNRPSGVCGGRVDSVGLGKDHKAIVLKGWKKQSGNF